MDTSVEVSLPPVALEHGEEEQITTTTSTVDIESTDAPAQEVEAAEAEITSPASPPALQPSPPRSEKRESRLPLPGSRLPLRKSSNPTLQSSDITPQKPRIALPTPRIQTSSLRRPSPGLSPVRSPSSGAGLSPGLKSQSSYGSLKSSSPATPTRIALPRSPISTGGGGQRSVSTSILPNTLKTPTRPPVGGSGIPSSATRRASGLPTITKTPSRDNVRSTNTSTTPVSAKTTPQPKRAVSVTPRIPAGRKSLAPSTDTTPSKTPTRTPLRARSFQAATPTSTTPSVKLATSPKATLSTPQPKPVSATPKVGSGIKLAKRPAVKPAPKPVEETGEALDKRQRAMASSQALRDQIKAARAARRESNAASGPNGFISGGGGGGGGNSGASSGWPDIIIAGVDDKKPEEEHQNSDDDGERRNRERDSGEDSDDEHPFGPEETPKALTIRPGGILDLTSKTMQDFTEEILGETDTLTVKVLLLQRNSLTLFSPVIKTFRGLYTLDLSCNSLKGEDYLAVDMEFPYLKTLLLHSNRIESLEAVVKHIDAPRLNYLDVHANKLKAFPGNLSARFGSLMTFVASDNKIEEVNVEGITGVQVVDLMNNCIATLPPKLGLLGDRGLREVRLSGNLFRVPRRQLLEKGTEAILEWLKDRIPVEEVKDEDEEKVDGEKEVEEEKEDGWDLVGRDEGRSGDDEVD
ncbi:hypothetical protein TWF694_008891 [Orbilia ellipsospora]|uniref:Uncharacterized protein n=1 Tax=Orbilia ellipsospora TaxID=2528407 RepID=A0AAV9XDM8_9PEZI